VIAGNVHMRYLLDLAARGFATTPTALIPRGEPAPLVRLCGERGWGDIVIKPAGGAASRGTLRFAEPESGEGRRHLDMLLRTGDALVPPYLRSVDAHGERALAWIDGEFTDAVRKTPRFSGGDEHVSDAVVIEPDEREPGERVLGFVQGDLLSARVDPARDDTGVPMVMELELVEPSLFLLQSARALERPVAALVRRIGVARA
jgi:hypothetical protein